MLKLTQSISAVVAAAMACMDHGDGVDTVAGVVMAIGAVEASAMLRQTLKVVHKLTLKSIRKQILRLMLIQSTVATEGGIIVADLDAVIAATLRQRQRAKTKQSAKLSPRQLLR